MTSERIAEIRARIAATTPGPWFLGGRIEDGDGYDHQPVDVHDGKEEIICEMDIETEYEAGFDAEPVFANHDFIAHARTDLPDALSAIEGLQSDLRMAKRLLEVHAPVEVLETLRELGWLSWPT